MLDGKSFQVVESGFISMGFIKPSRGASLETAQTELQKLQDFNTTNRDEQAVKRNWSNQWRVIIDRKTQYQSKQEFGAELLQEGTGGKKTSKTKKQAESSKIREEMKGRKLSPPGKGRRS